MEDNKKEKEEKPTLPEETIKELLEKGVIEVRVKYDPFQDDDWYDMSRYWA